MRGNTQSRLARASHRRAVPTPSGAGFRDRYRSNLARHLIGISRETATRVLSQLQADGLVRVRARRFVVGDPEELLDLMLVR